MALLVDFSCKTFFINDSITRSSLLPSRVLRPDTSLPHNNISSTIFLGLCFSYIWRSWNRHIFITDGDGDMLMLRRFPGLNDSSNDEYTCYLHNWSFFIRIHWPRVDSTHKGPIMHSVDVFFVINLNNMLKKIQVACDLRSHAWHS